MLHLILLLFMTLGRLAACNLCQDIESLTAKLGVLRPEFELLCQEQPSEGELLRWKRERMMMADGIRKELHEKQIQGIDSGRRQSDFYLLIASSASSFLEGEELITVHKYVATLAWIDHFRALDMQRFGATGGDSSTVALTKFSAVDFEVKLLSEGVKRGIITETVLPQEQLRELILKDSGSVPTFPFLAIKVEDDELAKLKKYRITLAIEVVKATAERMHSLHDPVDFGLAAYRKVADASLSVLDGDDLIEMLVWIRNGIAREFERVAAVYQSGAGGSIESKELVRVALFDAEIDLALERKKRGEALDVVAVDPDGPSFDGTWMTEKEAILFRSATEPIDSDGEIEKLKKSQLRACLIRVKALEARVSGGLENTDKLDDSRLKAFILASSIPVSENGNATFNKGVKLEVLQNAVKTAALSFSRIKALSEVGGGESGGVSLGMARYAILDAKIHLLEEMLRQNQ